MNAAPLSTEKPRPDFIRLTPQEVAARKRRNLALAGALVGFIVLVFVATVLNLQRNIAARGAAQAAAAAAASSQAAR